jgi:hypothetical protein
MQGGPLDQDRALANRGNAVLVFAGAAVALVIAVLLFTRFSIDGSMSRDEAVYAYAGQQQAEGVPFYVSIFDQKTPLAPMIAAGGVVIGRAIEADDVYAMRVMFFVLACLTVAAVYLLATSLFGSALVGLVSAAVFASFKAFAFGALTGPQAKQAAIFFAVLSMAFVVRRHYFWGAFAGSLAFLAWQPLAAYPLVAIAVAALTAGAGQRWKRAGRATAGAAIPLAVVAVYFWVEGALDDLVRAAFIFPATYLQRADESIVERLRHIASVVDEHYDGGEVLFWGGLVLLLGVFALRLARRRSHLRELALDDPFVNVVVVSLFPIAAFSASDFQGAPDLYPLLPYAAIGIGAGFHVALTRLETSGLRRVGAAVAIAAPVTLVATSWISYSAEVPEERALVRQRADAAKVEQLLSGDETLYALGSPRPLVFTRRRNPSPYIILIGGIDAWRVDHTRGGFDGWTDHIRADDPDIIVKGGPWRSPYAQRMTAWLRREYALIRMDGLVLFVKPEVCLRAEQRAVRCSPRLRNAAPR